MMLSHVTLRDPTLPHQVVFQSDGVYVVVACNCRLRRYRSHGYKPFGLAPDLDAARVLYNDPANHDKPFDPEQDGARW